MSNVRALKLFPIYQDYIDEKYIRSKSLKEKSFQEQYAHIVSDWFSWGDVWKYYLERYHNWEVLETFPNVENLQKAWMREQGLKISSKQWQLDIIYKQIELFQPSVLIVYPTPFFHSQHWQELKKQYPFLRLIISADGIARNCKETYAGCDVIFSCIQSVVEYYKINGFKSLHFPYAFDRRVLDAIVPVSDTFPITFSGSINVYQSLHKRRLELLAELCKYFDIGIYTDAFSSPNSWKLFGSEQIKTLLKEKNVSCYLNRYRLGLRRKPAVFGLKMFELMSNSKIVFNSHIGQAKNYASNLRLFEATGVGACLVTDYQPNLSEYFDIENEVVTYKSKEELIDKVRYLLDNECERKSIAEAGQRRTLSEHHYKFRFNQFVDLITEYI